MLWKHMGWVLLAACASQPRPQPQNETAQTSQNEPAQPSQSEPASAEADRVSAEREDDALPDIPPSQTIEWPDRFLGETIPALMEAETLMALYRDDGHRAHQLELVPIDDASGWVVDRGIVTSPDYQQSLYERWSKVEQRNGELIVLSQVGRNEVADGAPRSVERETHFEACSAHHAHCASGCEGDRRCAWRCGETAGECLGTEHRLALGDAVVALRHHPSVRIEWGGESRELNDLERINVTDHPTRPVPFFARVRRERLARGRDVIVISYGHGCDEDAYCAFQRLLIQRDGELVELDGQPFNSVRELELRGDGTLRWTGREMRICRPSPRALERHRAVREHDDDLGYWWHEQRPTRHTARISAEGEVEIRPARSGRWGACTPSIAAACPYVDIVTDEGTTRVGEILRWIRDDPATQGLTLPELRGERVRMRLSEEKLETTYLDAVWLELDGERVDPTNHDFAADGRYEVMRRGDTIELEFPLRPHTQARLVAVGYYVVYSARM